jgi:hypothetical protein
LVEVMSTLRKCPNCENIQATGGFCTKCGTDLSKVKPFIEDYAPVIVRNEAREYRVLRFVSDLFVFMGALIIVVSIISACLLALTSAGVDAVVSQEGGRVLSDVIGASGIVGAILLIVIGVSAGLGEIAAGQLIMVFLDIRDDVRRMTNTLE